MILCRPFTAPLGAGFALDPPSHAVRPVSAEMIPFGGGPPPLAGRLDQSEDGEDDGLGKRIPGRAKACESGVNRRQIVQIGAWVALLRRCWCEH